jgi:AraC family transcriptional regulator
MKATGTGRIVLWGGGSVWIGRAGEATGFHSHHAVQITLPFPGGEVRFRRPEGTWTSYRGATVAANQPHAFEARDTSVALIFAEPESREGRAIHRRSLAEGIMPLADGTTEVPMQALTAAYERAAPDRELEAAARSVTAALAKTIKEPEAPLDSRVERALAVLRGRLEETVLLSEIADAVNLSPDRFRHLFIEETGMRFRPYVLWLRIELALAQYVAGKSLTEAAHAGGFADSAHLSRTFKRMFGVAPGSFQFESV